MENALELPVSAPQSRKAAARLRAPLFSSLAALALTGCVAAAPAPDDIGIPPLAGFAVSDNDTPHSRCLAALKPLPGARLPAVAVGEVADKTGQVNFNENGYALSQGASEMVMSALFKTGKVDLVERFDLRVVNEALRLRNTKLIAGPLRAGSVRPSDFIVIGALTELNYNIMSGGAGLWVAGAGGGARTVVVNVALDLRLVKTGTLEVAYVTSLQKQIQGFEVEANVFRFFGSTLIEFDAGMTRNEPLQLGVRSVVEMAVYQLLTDYLGLPADASCALTAGHYNDDKEIQP